MRIAIALAVAAAIGGASPVLASGDGDERSSSAPVERAVVERLTAHGKASFWVVLDEGADLAPARAMRDRRARGRLVFDRLNDVAFRSQTRVRGLLAARGVAYRPFWIMNAIRVRAAGRDVVDAVAAFPEVVEIRATRTVSLHEASPAPSGPGTHAVEWNIANVNADDVWSTFGARGEGIVVANIDTGVRYTHEALRIQYRGRNADGTYDHDYDWWDPAAVCAPGAPCDNRSHGTHTMGTIVGDDRNPGTNQIGAAPGAKWIAAKGCETNSCSDAALLSAGQFMLAPTDLAGANPRPELRPHVVNNSWGDFGTWEVYRHIVQAWVASGIFPVFANGNDSSPGCGDVTAPAGYPESFGVGSHTSDNLISHFSRLGPSPIAPFAIKPDLTAPGTSVRSARNGSDSEYGILSGTSMAAPHVAGAVAVLWSAVPGLQRNIAATRAILARTAVDVDDTTCGGTASNNNVWGEGRLDVLAAVTTALAPPLPPPPPPPPAPLPPPPPPPPASPRPPRVRQCVVPRVIGLKTPTARQRIRARNCAVGKVRRVRARGKRVGKVLAQSPRRGTVRRAGFPVYLFVGRR